MALATDLPGRLDFRWYARNVHPVTLTWPSTLAGRTFEVRLDGETDPIAVTVNAAVASFTVPAVTANAKKQAWSFVETTLTDVTWIGGTIHWGVAYDDVGDGDDFAVTVGADAVVTVNVSGGIPLAAEAATRASADTALGVRIDTEASDRATGDALKLAKASNLSDVANASTALTNLGVSTFAKTILDDADAATVRGTIGAQAAGTSLALTASVGLFSTFAGTPPAITLETYVRTAGHGSNGVGAATYVYDAAVDATYVTANPRASFIAADGRGFRLLPLNNTPYQFGALGDGSTDDAVPLQAFLDFITTNNVGRADVSGSFRSSVALTFGRLATPATLKVEGWFVLQMTGSGRFAVTVKNFAGQWDTVKVTGTGDPTAGNYATRTWETGLALDGTGRSSFRRIDCRVFAFAGVLGGLNNNTLADYGNLRALDCGSGSATFGMSTTWSSPVNNGSASSNAQTTTLTVAALPPSFIGSTEYGTVGDAPYMVRITDADGSKRLHYIQSVNSGASTINVFPWVSSTAVPGSMDYVWGGALVLKGSDSNVATFNELDATRCGMGLAATSLYGPQGKAVVTQFCGAGLVFGRSPTGAAYGSKIDGAYCESNSEDIVYLSIGVNTYAAVDSDYGVSLAKTYVLNTPRAADNSLSKSAMPVIYGRFTNLGRRHSYEKAPYGLIAGTNSFTINRPDMVYPLVANSVTIAPVGLDLNLHRLTGYDTCRVIVTGTAAAGTPSGTVTFNVPTANPETWTLNGGAVPVAFSSFAAGPAEFLVTYNASTLNCTVKQIVRSLTTVIDSYLAGVDLSRTAINFHTRRTPAAASAIVDATAYFTPLLVAVAGSIGTIRLRTSVAASGGSGTRANLGIYASSGGRPTGDAIEDFGAVDLTATAGPISVSHTTASLAIGLYFICLTTKGYTGQASIYKQTDIWPFLEAATNVITGGGGLTQVISSAALPTVGTLVNSDNAPALTVVPI